MALVVLGRESTDDLQAWVDELFEHVPAASAITKDPETPIYLPDSLPLMQMIQPVKEIRQAVFSFAIPSALDDYHKKPLSYIANILGDEGPGSLLHLLKRRGWAEGLSAGSGLSYAEHATFEVTVSLTKTGLENYQAIGHLLFSLINLIRDEGVLYRLFKLGFLL